MPIVGGPADTNSIRGHGLRLHYHETGGPRQCGSCSAEPKPLALVYRAARRQARVAKLVDAKDLKSFGAMHRVGSIPTPGTIVFNKIHPSLVPALLWIEVVG